MFREVELAGNDTHHAISQFLKPNQKIPSARSPVQSCQNVIFGPEINSVTSNCPETTLNMVGWG